MKKTLIIFAMILAIAATALCSKAVHADNDAMLKFEEITVWVDGKEDKSADENGGSVEVNPASTLKVKVKVLNLYTREEDNEIDNVKVKATLLGINNGDDIEEKASKFDLGADRSRSVTMEFDIPLKVDDESYTLLIEAEGEDQNSTDHFIEIEIEVEVDKEEHRLHFEEVTLGSSTLDCIRTTQLRIVIINIGQEEEEEVLLTAINDKLGLAFSEEIDIIDADPFEDFSRTINIDATGLAPGVYPIVVRAEYDGNDERITETRELVVQSCADEQTLPPVDQDDEPDAAADDTADTTDDTADTTDYAQDAVVVDNPRPVQYVTGGAVAKPISFSSSHSSDWWEKNKWIAVVIVTDIVLVLVGILIFISRRKR